MGSFVFKIIKINNTDGWENIYVEYNKSVRVDYNCTSYYFMNHLFNNTI